MEQNLSAYAYDPAYAAARTVAARVRPHFERHRAEPLAAPGQKAPLPDAAAMEAMIDAGFWASLRREEGYVPLISLAFVPPQEVARPLLFERPFPLAPASLTRVAPAVERPGIHLGVWRQEADLCVWGATHGLPPFCFVLEVVAPGLLVVKHTRAEQAGKFVNVAVLQGDHVKVIDQRAAAVPDCPPLLTTLLGLESQFSTGGPVSVLIQLAVSMRAHARGGTLLVVPTGSDAWRQSILQPVTYGVAPPFAVLADLMQTDAEERAPRKWRDALDRAVAGIAGLTAVDGATIITSQYELLAFGAKIVRRSGSPHLTQVIVTEPVEDAAPATLEPSELGGTRHLSAAQFAHDQRDAIALVASQDGRFTVFGWSPCEDMVHAHRIETLLF